MRIFLVFILFLLLGQQTTVNGQQTLCTRDVYPNTVDCCPLTVDYLEGCQYLIVTPNSEGIAQWADTLAKFRNEQGILTKVVSLNEIGNNYPVNIRNYFISFSLSVSNQRLRDKIKNDLTLYDPMDYSPPESSAHVILQARILECIAISFSRGSSRPRD